MRSRTKHIMRMTVCLWLFSILVLSSCGFGSAPTPLETNKAKGSRDNSPRILTPMADGKITYDSDSTSIDASHLEDGYVMARYIGSAKKVKMQLIGPDAITYTYDLQPGADYDTFPLSAGSGEYQMIFYENLTENKYITIYSQDLMVALKDEFTPFLYPNQFVMYDKSSRAVEKASDLAASADTDLEVVANIYAYIIENIEYDDEKANKARSGEITSYLPNMDDTLMTGRGICFDYAALITCMLRAQGIPAKLQIGLAGDVKHAWISTYLRESGWIDNIIQFDGQEWTLMDPTFAANSSVKSMQKYIGEGSHYTLQYSR